MYLGIIIDQNAVNPWTPPLAVIARLLEIASDRTVLEDLVSHSQIDKTEDKVELNRLIAQKEQEHRDAQQSIDNLVAVLARNASASPESVLERIAADEARRGQITQAIDGLKKRRDSGGRVIQIGKAFKLFSRFRHGFNELVAHKQREILRDIVRKIVIEKEGARVFYYSLPHEDLLRGIAMGIEPKLEAKRVDEHPNGSDPLPDGCSSNVPLYGGGAKVVEPLAIGKKYPVRWKKGTGNRSGNR